jgi:hypothetical protein
LAKEHLVKTTISIEAAVEGSVSEMKGNINSYGEANGTKLRNMLGMTNLLLLAVVVLLAVQVFRKPQPVGRFQPRSENSRLALDTKTGKLCWAVRLGSSGEDTEQQPSRGIPVCSDLE